MFKYSKQKNFKEVSEAISPKTPWETPVLNLLDSSHTQGSNPAADESTNGPMVS